MQHSSLGASGAKRWLACPGSIRLTANLPPSPTNRYAAEGTVAHAVAEAALNARCKAEKFIGMYGNGETDVGLYDEPNNHEFEFEVTREMADAVQVYLDAIQEKIDELTFAGHEPQLMVENRVSLDHIQAGMFGTNDCAIWVPGVYLGVWDYKHGKGVPVEVEDNPQTNYYGVGALRQVGVLDVNGARPTRDHFRIDQSIIPQEVEMVIVQPRASHANGPVRRWSTTAQYLLGDFSKTLREGARETLKEDSAIVAGEHCRWCQAETFCPALKQAAQDAMRSTFNDMEIDLADLDDKPKKVATKLTENVVTTVSPSELAQIVRLIPVIESWAASMKEHAQTRLENGEAIPGFKLVRGVSRRRWKDEKAAAEFLGLVLEDEELFKEPKLRPFTELEKHKAAGLLVADLLETPEGKLTIAPETDSRPAAVKSAAQSAVVTVDDLL